MTKSESLFQGGERVCLNDAYSVRREDMENRIGTVVPHRKKLAKDRVDVLWDGESEPQRFHASLLEHI